MEMPINVVISKNRMNSGCVFYRQYQPMLTGRDLGLWDLKHVKGWDNIAALAEGGNIFFTRGANKHPDSPKDDVLEFICGLKEISKKFQKMGFMKYNIVFDYDDMIGDYPPYMELYAKFGCEPTVCELDNGEQKFLRRWIDKQSYCYSDGEKTFFDVERNRAVMKSVFDNMREADAVTCTTEYLKKKLQQYNPNVYVLRNGLDFSLYNPKPNDSFVVRIGYVLSNSHFADWLDIAPHLRRVINETPNVQLVLMGNKFEERFMCGIDPSKVEWHEYTKLMDGYYQVMSNLKIDIGLCPLIDTEFNKCKSELKWLEYSALNAVTLASNVLYGDYICDGETGFLYDTHEEFVHKLRYLISHGKKRKETALNALEYIKPRYAIEEVVKDYRAAFEDIIKKGELQNEKVMVLD